MNLKNIYSGAYRLGWYKCIPRSRHSQKVPEYVFHFSPILARFQLRQREIALKKIKYRPIEL